MQRRRVSMAVHGALLAAAPVLVARAQEAPPRLPTVTVVAKVAQPLSEVAATVTVIDAGDIVDTLSRDAGDLLRFEPGVSIGNDPARFGLGAVSIRGLGGNRVLVETDGVPAAAGFAIGSYSDTGRPLTDLGIVQRVEILRGPASSLYGSDALAGVVALTTVRPADLLGLSGTHAATMRTGYAGVDDGWSASLLAAGRQGDFAGLVGAGSRRGHEAAIASRSIRPNPASRYRDTLHLRLERDSGAGPVGLTVTGDRFGALTDIDSLELSGGRFANTTFLRGDDSQRNLRLVLDQSLGTMAGVDEGEWRLYWQRTAVDELTNERRRATPVSAPLAIDRRFRYDESVAGGELTLARRTGHHRLVGGLEFSRSRIDERRDGLQTNLDTGGTTSVILGESLPVRDFPVSDVTEAGLYLQDDWRPGAGAFSVITALRADLYRLEPRADAIYRQDNPVQVPVGVETLSVSPRLGFTWRLREAATVFVQYAHGFRAPPFEDVNIGLDLPQFNVRAIPNPGLRPERSDSVEAGWRLDGKALAGTASAWLGRYRDFIQSKVNLGRDPATGVILFQSQNVGRAEIWGLEAALSASLAAINPRLQGFSADFSAAYAHGDDLEHHVPLDSIEPTRVVFGLRYAGPASRWHAAVHATAAAAKRRVDPTRPDPLRIPGFVSVDCTAGWKLSRTWRVDAGVFNLGNASYFEWADVQGRPAGDPLLELYRRPGRNWRISVTGSW